MNLSLTNILCSDWNRSPKDFHEFFSIKPNLHKIVDKGTEWCQGEGSNKDCHKTILDNYRRDETICHETRHQQTHRLMFTANGVHSIHSSLPNSSNEVPAYLAQGIRRRVLDWSVPIAVHP